MSATLDPADALYREVVLEHYRRPRHRTPLDAPDGEATLHNPLCGDQVRVQVRRDADGRVCEVSARSRGCAIAVASGSVMTELVQGLDAREVAGLHARLAAVVEQGAGAAEADSLEPRLRAFERVYELPSRRRCATLAWEALSAALAPEVSSETTR